MAIEWFCDIQAPIDSTPAGRRDSYLSRHERCPRCNAALPGRNLPHIDGGFYESKDSRHRKYRKE